MIYATAGLVETLLRQAEDADPDGVTIPLATTPAADLPGCDCPDDTEVFTHFYLPSAGNSVSFVFGYDLGTPVGQTSGQFVSHPDGRLGVSQEDELHQVVFVAVPPWDRASIAPFDRRGRERELTILDVEPPEEVIADLPEEVIADLPEEVIADLPEESIEGTDHQEASK